MASQPSLPEIDRDLIASRERLEHDFEALRQTVRGNLRELRPRRQLHRHPLAATAVAAFAGLLAGRLFAAIVNAFRR